MSRFGVLRGDGLLRALSAHFELSETRVAEDGLVRTRFYQKFGLLIRESVKLPDDERSESNSEPEIHSEPLDISPIPQLPAPQISTNGIEASEMIGRIPTNGIATHAPELNGHGPENHVELDVDGLLGKVLNGVAPYVPEFNGHIPENGVVLTAEELLDRVLNGVNARALESNGKIPGNGKIPVNGKIQPNGVEAHASELICLGDALRPAPARLALVERLLAPVDRLPAPAREIEAPEWLVKSKRWSLADLQEMLAPEEAAEPESFAPAAASPIKAPQVVYAVLSNKRVALIAFPEHQIKRLRSEFEAQFCHVRVVTWEDFDTTKPDLASLDLAVMRLDTEEDDVRRDKLTLSDKPTLIVGDREYLIQLNPEFAGTPFDFVAHPCNPVEVVWRSANLLTRNSHRFEPSLAAPGAQPPEEKALPASVLIADDDPAAATLLYTALTSQGIECQVTQNGMSALESARRGGLGAVILEAGLPGLDGFQILAELKRDPNLAKLRVMFLTARQSESDILRAFGLGADDYLTKPFSPMEVVARIKRLIERRS